MGREGWNLRRVAMIGAAIVLLGMGAGFTFMRKDASGGRTDPMGSLRPAGPLISPAGSRYVVEVSDGTPEAPLADTCVELRIERPDGSESGFGHCFPETSGRQQQPFGLALYLECRDPKESFLVGTMTKEVETLEIVLADGRSVKVHALEGIPLTGRHHRAYVTAVAGVDPPMHVRALDKEGQLISSARYRIRPRPCDQIRADSVRLVLE